MKNQLLVERKEKIHGEMISIIDFFDPLFTCGFS